MEIYFQYLRFMKNHKPLINICVCVCRNCIRLLLGIEWRGTPSDMKYSPTILKIILCCPNGGKKILLSPSRWMEDPPKDAKMEGHDKCNLDGGPEESKPIKGPL